MPTLSLPARHLIARNVARALTEDIGDGDRTASLIAADTKLKTRVIVRQQAIMAGRPWFDEVFRQVDPAVKLRWSVADGDTLEPDQELVRLKGPARSILTAERTALNFLQTLSGTATRANRYVQAVAGTGVHILDTRKTLPGMRLAQKYASRCGGAMNHRMGLYDAILIKENHIAAAGSISQAVAAAQSDHPGIFLEVEVENLEQLAEAAEAGAQRVLLDNFDLGLLGEAARQFGERIDLEASGGVTLDTVRGIAETGIHYISTGDITKSVDAVDLSMRFIKPKKD